MCGCICYHMLAATASLIHQKWGVIGFFIVISRFYCVGFTKNDCQHHEHACRSLERLCSALWKESNLRSESPCSWNISPPPHLQPDLSCYSEVSVWKRANESPGWSTRSRNWSASSVNILCPFDRFFTEYDHQKGEDPRQPQAGYGICGALASAREIEYCLCSTTMMLLGVIRHNNIITHMLLSDAFRCHLRIKG